MSDPYATISADPYADIAAPTPRARPPASPPRKAPPKRSGWDEATGFLANINRGLGIGDELAAAVKTGTNVVTGKVPFGRPGESPLDVLGQDFQRSMQGQRAVEDDFGARRPLVARGAQGLGNAATVAVPGGPTVQAYANAPRLMNAARGAVAAGTTAAAYGAADRGTPGERLRAASAASINPVVLALGAGGGALAPAAKRPGPPRKPSPQAVLKDQGIRLTPGQRMGGMAKNAEDLAMRAPILGPAISGARERVNEQLNRVVALKALEPIGGTLPKTIPAGFDAVRHVDEEIGKVYDQAAAKVPVVQLDAKLADDLKAIAARSSDLPDSLISAFGRVMTDRLGRLADGPVSGAKLKGIHSELGKIQRSYAKKGEDVLADMFGDARQALMAQLGRNSPEAAELVAKADEGWSIYKIMNKAARATKDGVFTPGQLATQVRTAADQRGSNIAGKGEGLLQDLSSAASKVMPDQFGNPGTANAMGLGAAGVGLLKAPVETATAGAALTAAATPYWLMGRKLIEELPPTASRADVMAAQDALAQLARHDPEVAALQQELAARLSRTAGIAAQPTSR